MKTSYDECPYCGKDITEEMSYHDPMGEGDEMDVECPFCEKTFMVSASYRVNYSTWEAPCLNDGGEHIWKQIIGCPKEYYENRFRCEYCGKEEKRK